MLAKTLYSGRFKGYFWFYSCTGVLYNDPGFQKWHIEPPPGCSSDALDTRGWSWIHDHPPYTPSSGLYMVAQQVGAVKVVNKGGYMLLRGQGFPSARLASATNFTN